MNWVTLLGLIATAVTVVSLLAAMAYAFTQWTLHTRPAQWLLLGLTLWLVASLAALLVAPLLARFVEPQQFVFVHLGISAASSCVHALGLLCVVRAVFVARDQRGAGREAQVWSDRSETRDANPFSSPRAM